MPATALHHAAICTSDVDRSLVFWRDGLGLSEQFDLTFAGAWRELFGAQTDELRSIFLGDPDASRSAAPTLGLFLLSFERDVDETLAGLAKLGFADGVRRIAMPAGGDLHVDMAVVTAPDGVLVELIGPPR